MFGGAFEKGENQMKKGNTIEIKEFVLFDGSSTKEDKEKYSIAPDTKKEYLFKNEGIQPGCIWRATLTKDTKVFDSGWVVTETLIPYIFHEGYKPLNFKVLNINEQHSKSIFYQINNANMIDIRRDLEIEKAIELGEEEQYRMAVREAGVRYNNYFIFFTNSEAIRTKSSVINFAVPRVIAENQKIFFDSKLIEKYRDRKNYGIWLSCGAFMKKDYLPDLLWISN